MLHRLPAKGPCGLGWPAVWRETSTSCGRRRSNKTAEHSHLQSPDSSGRELLSLGGAMVLDAFFRRASEKFPIPMMLRVLLERVLQPERVDAWSLEPWAPTRGAAGGVAGSDGRGGLFRPGLRRCPLHGRVPATGANRSATGGGGAAQARSDGGASRGPPLVGGDPVADGHRPVRASARGFPAAAAGGADVAPGPRDGGVVCVSLLPGPARLPSCRRRPLCVWRVGSA